MGGGKRREVGVKGQEKGKEGELGLVWKNEK